jgi:hypothetical protein
VSWVEIFNKRWIYERERESVVDFEQNGICFFNFRHLRWNLVGDEISVK